MVFLTTLSDRHPSLGAYLYESSNQTSQYLVYANLTGQYLNHHLYNGTIMLDTANIATCAVDTTTAFTYNTGYTLEGIAILANLTSTDDGSGMYRDWLVNLFAWRMMVLKYVQAERYGSGGHQVCGMDG